ncbi:unnamed protein product [Euphydryas editha]|uniref:Peptidoglycan recognition protein n=1 Tax=Euphydryas editha TaxID=104508 RepID=A0AAU9UXS0_EUPED|nr:unnamed protein product [Euphydryas editha]
MSLKLDKTYSSNSIGTKVVGDLGDIQVSDDSDSENNKKVSRTLTSKLSIPPNLIKNTVPVFGSVTVSSSDNVQFGNNTYFNGPVTIKQVIQNKSGVDNVAYINTETENDTSAQHSHKGEIADTSIKKEQILLWHKITFSAVCFTVIGSIIAIVLVLQNNTVQQRNTDQQTDFQISNSSSDPLLIAPDHLRIVSRSDWLAEPVDRPLTVLKLPAPWVIITHTATESCHTQSQCVLRVRLIQTFHIESRGWYDIGYNFLVGGDGSVYYGRGWDYEGAHTKGYNKYSIGIAFIGTFNSNPPPKRQIEACKKLIKQGVQLNKIAKDYKLFAHRQLMSTLSPGDEVYNIIKTWPHFVSNFTDTGSLIPSGRY